MAGTVQHTTETHNAADVTIRVLLDGSFANLLKDDAVPISFYGRKIGENPGQDSADA